MSPDPFRNCYCNPLGGYISGMRPLIVASVVLFLIAAISAFSTSVNLNEVGFIALGLAAFAGDQLTEGFGSFRAGGRPLARRGARRL